MIIGTIERNARGSIVLQVRGKDGLCHPLRGPGANALRFRADIGPMKPEYVGRRVITRPCGKWMVEPLFHLWAYAPERRATRAHLRHFIADAVERKAAAKGIVVPPDSRSPWDTGTIDAQTFSVHQLARRALEYARFRAFMRGTYSDWPADKPARDFWQALALGQPARFYDPRAGEFVERVGGKASAERTRRLSV
ncbi:hypothetical protein U1872_06175 [Sphingomonas sp. RB3P16]|uniref:hypothetical protein n=1 Tax=Parasphingomonas frigoris TaxID=3096163 RepID=UPI002FC799DA